MEFNLALILTVLTAVSGIFVAVDKFYYRKRVEQEAVPRNAVLETVIEYSRSFFPCTLE